MTTTTTRPCWHCGTRHQSSTMPALCSDACTAAWQERYRIAFGEEPMQEPVRHTNHRCIADLAAHDWQPIPHDPTPDIDQALQTAADRRERWEQRVLELHAAGHLGYAPAIGAWVDQNGTPLSAVLHAAANRLASAGVLSRIELLRVTPKVAAEDNSDFPDEARPADEPQDVLDDRHAQIRPTLEVDGPCLVAEPPLISPIHVGKTRPFADAPEPAFLARLLNALRKWKP